MAPSIVSASLKVLDILSTTTDLRDKLQENTRYFREGMKKAGLNILEGEHAITPVMIGDARTASQMADALMDEGIYVIGFSYPVVPKGQARIRVQVSAGHTREDLNKAIDAFTRVASAMNLI